MITVQDLKDMSKGFVFAKGELQDNAQGINMTGSGKTLRWIAVRGQIEDWAIYCGWHDWDWEYIRSNGDKVHSVLNIRNCVNVDDEAMEMYRF